MRLPLCESSAESITDSGTRMNADRPRRISDPRQAAEAAFKSATAKPPEPIPQKPPLPGGKEMVSLRLDREVLDHFQKDGPGWQDRINDALRKAAAK
jgi:uncharacterized protein (DUF4415 family)